MKKRLPLPGFLLACVFNVLLAEPPSYIQTKDGVIVFNDPVFTGSSNAVKLEVVSDNITRVIAVPGTEILTSQGLVTVYSKERGLSWNEVSSKEILTLKTKKLTVFALLKTGVVPFRDNSSKKILTEKPIWRTQFSVRRI